MNNKTYQEVPRSDEESLVELISSNSQLNVLRLDNISKSVQVTVDRDSSKQKSACTCRKPKTTKTILKDISATFYSGECSAIMGRSGAGKSSLLDIISSVGKEEGTTGSILYNDKAVKTKWRRMCCLVPQNDILYPALTVRQTIWFSARLRLDQSLPVKAIDQATDKVISDLELGHASNIRIELLSGGERKRVSLGCELVVEPTILICDEVTSGLDSHLAEEVVKILCQAAERRNTVIICTIHQPSARVFGFFSRVLVLQRGRTVYSGNTKDEMHEYFARNGMVAPEWENPIDFYMREIYLREQANEGCLITAWKEREKSDKQLSSFAPSAGDDVFLAKEAQTLDAASSACNSWWHQFKVLMRRQFIDTLLDRQKFYRYVKSKLFMGLVVGVAFLNQGRSISNGNIETVMGVLFFIVIVIQFTTHQKTLVEYPMIRVFILREYRNGSFDLYPYALAHALTSIFFECIATSFILPAYFMAGLGHSAVQFFLFYAASLVITANASLVGLILGAASKDIKAVQTNVAIVILFVWFAGYAIPVSLMPPYLSWLYYISFLQYGYVLLVINQFQGVVFTDSIPYANGTQFLLARGIDPDDLGLWAGILCLYCLGLLLVCLVVVRQSIRKFARTSR